MPFSKSGWFVDDSCMKLVSESQSFCADYFLEKAMVCFSEGLCDERNWELDLCQNDLAHYVAPSHTQMMSK